MLILANTDTRRGRPKLYSPGDFMPQFGAKKTVKLMDQEDWNDFKAMMIASAG